MAPIICSCLLSLIYTLYLFIANEESSFHQAQEYENRFWTIFALLFSTALFFANDSPLAFGQYSPTLGFIGVLLSSYAMHLWDRYLHRLSLSRQTKLRRSAYSLSSTMGNMKDTVEEHLAKINKCLGDIDQLLIPSTINNWINQRFVFRKEKEIISVFANCDAVTLNYLIGHAKLGLVIYKIKDHRNFAGQHRTELIQLLAVDRLPALTVMSRVIVLHALQILKLRANPRAEHWARNIILNTHGDDLSEIKTLTDSKGDYFCMNKLIFEDIKSETVRQDILNHIRKEGVLQLAHMQMETKRAQRRKHMAWRKILSDVDDTLCSSGGHYPAGIDKRYAKKVVYPGVLAFYRELDLGTSGPEEWPESRVGNLVFLSARPHVYKDMSENRSFSKFEKLHAKRKDGRRGMHTVPSLLPGDLVSGSQFMVTNDFEPLARKKFENFKKYVSIYPEYQHIFVCDNGQGDVKASEMMFDNSPYEFGPVYVHKVQPLHKTHGYEPEKWRKKEFMPCFFSTYPEAALDAAKRNPPLIRLSGLRRVCVESVKDFYSVSSKEWNTPKQKSDRRQELNQALWTANKFLEEKELKPVELIKADRLYQDGEKVNTPYGKGIIKGFDPDYDMYDVEIDWRPIDIQVKDHLQHVKEEAIRPRNANDRKAPAPLQTVLETDEVAEDEYELSAILENDDLPNFEQNENSLMLESEGEKKNGSPSEQKTPAASTISDTASLSSISSDGSPQEQKAVPPGSNFKISAKITGSKLSKYTPPHLPVLDKKPAPLFSFWTASPTKRATFQAGDKCSSPYGPAVVVEYRVDDKIVVVDMTGWKARAYLNEKDVKITNENILSSLFRRPPLDSTPKPLEFPYALGTKIITPYGEAEVFKPLSRSKKIAQSPKTEEPDVSNETIGLQLTSWTLADDSHPKMYCTVKTVQMWKDTKDKKSSVLSAFGNLLSIPLSRFTSPKPRAIKPESPKFHRYYSDATKVSTLFGNGVVLQFREEDGFYEISLTGWKLANGKYPTAWLREVDIRCQVAEGCQEGYPVLTKMGLTGTLESVQATTGVHVVTVPTAGMVMYLQPDAIVKPLKAAVGEDALTAYGEGTVQNYDVVNDTYTIKLEGWDAKLYCKAETFDRLSDWMRERDGSTGMDWLLGLFFAPSSDKSVGTRSRTNSVASLRSHSARSVS